jgi:hypothetical protein
MASQQTIDLVVRGRAVYDAKYRSSLEATNFGEFVAVEPESEEFFLGKTLSEAIQAARAVHADRLPVVFRVGHKAAIEIGVLNG